MLTRLLPLARAQPPNEPADPPSKLASAYRAAPVADRVSVSYAVPGSPEARSVVTVRVDAGSVEAAHPRPARVRLTLGRLEVYAEGEALAAYLRGEAKTCYEGKLAGPLTPASLRGALPALPLAQLQWALGDEAARSSVHPYGLATTPEGAEADGALRFRAGDGRVTLRVDARGGRARSITFTGDDSSVLRLEFTAIEAGDPATWGLDLSGRTRVATLAELQSHAPVNPVGVRLPELGLVDAELRNVTGAELRGRGSGGGASGGGGSGGGGGVAGGAGGRDRRGVGGVRRARRGGDRRGVAGGCRGGGAEVGGIGGEGHGRWAVGITEAGEGKGAVAACWG